MDSVPLLVLGGGICGLAATEEAGRLGATALLIERESTLGGLLRTDRRDGFSFDRGGHRFITSIPFVLDRVQNLLGDRLLLRQRRSLIFWNGRLIEYPLRIGNLLRELGPCENIRAFGSYLAAAAFRRPFRKEDNLEQWIRNRFGSYLYEAVFADYTRKLWGIAPDKISAEWAPRRISIPSLGGFLKEMVAPSRPAPRTYARSYLYPRTGIGEIPDHFAASILNRGGRIMTNSRVRSLERARHGWTARIEHRKSSFDIAAESVISTIPLVSLLRILNAQGKPDVPVLPTRALRLLNLGFREPVPLDATWIYQPSPQCRFTRLQIPAARSPEMVPQGCGSVQLEEPDTGNGSLKERKDAAIDLLDELGFPTQPEFAFETREPQAYPVYRPESRRKAEEALAWVRTLPDLSTAGRQGEFSYVFLDRALADGVNSARRALGHAAYELGAPPRNDAPDETASLLEERE